ncbi:hypothetical protein Tco_1463318, partial [Tanacetum coccineum]
MEMKDTFSSCSDSDEQWMQQMQDKAKESSIASFRLLHSYLKHRKDVKDDGSPKVSNSSHLVSPTATINMPRELYNVDVAATFGVPLTTVGDLHLLIKSIEAGNGFPRKGQKSKPKRQNRARERKEREREVKSKPKVNKSQQKVKVKSSQSQPREVDLERASKTEPEILNCQKWAHPYPPSGPGTTH